MLNLTTHSAWPCCAKLASFGLYATDAVLGVLREDSRLLPVTEAFSEVTVTGCLWIQRCLCSTVTARPVASRSLPSA